MSAGKSGSSGTPSAATAGGGSSAWAQYRAGEQSPMGQPTGTDPMGEARGSSYASSMSPNATMSAPSAGTGADINAPGTNWLGLTDEQRAAFADSMKGIGGHGGHGVPSFSMSGDVGHVGTEQGAIQVPALRFALTPGQSRILRGLGLDEEGGRKFLVNQVLSGNPAYGPYTVQQVQAAKMVSGGGASA